MSASCEHERGANIFSKGEICVCPTISYLNNKAQLHSNDIKMRKNTCTISEEEIKTKQRGLASSTLG